MQPRDACSPRRDENGLAAATEGVTDMYAVAGVTGHTGAVAAETLLSQGKGVRVVVRSAEKGEPWRKRGAEVAVADLSDPAALARAIEGTEGVYLLSPPNFATTDLLADRKVLLEKMVEALKRARARNVVFLSAIGAQHPAGTGPIVTVHRAEAALRGIAPSVTFVRAANFLENWGAVARLAKAQGILPHFGPVDVKFPQVGTRDIGTTVARALVEARGGTRVIELAGREDWSPDDVAAALATLLGKPVKAIGAPVESARAGLEQAGLPGEIARLFAEMYAGIASGLVAWEHPQAIARGTTPLVDALRPLV
jgi:uncharacterized protein YbjT (DUF2867 family)